MVKLSTSSAVELAADLGRQLSDTTILMHEAIARHAGLTGTDHKYLSILLRRGTMTAGELSQTTGLSTGAITGVIDRFEKRGLVRRVADKADRRKILIQPNTQKANDLFRHAHLDLKERVGQLIATFSKEEQQTIERYIVASIDIIAGITAQLNVQNND